MADTQNLGFSNPYLDQSIASSLKDTTDAYNNVTQPAYNSAMIRSGSFGNSGVDQMNQFSNQQLQTSLGRQANDMRSNNYQFDQNMNRSLYNDAYSQNQQNLQTATGLYDWQNKYDQQDLTNATTQQNAPMNYYSNFSNSANSIGQGYGNSSQTATGQGSPLTGALGGAQLGNYFSNQWGNSGSNGVVGSLNNPTNAQSLDAWGAGGW